MQWDTLISELARIGCDTSSHTNIPYIQQGLAKVSADFSEVAKFYNTFRMVRHDAFMLHRLRTGFREAVGKMAIYPDEIQKIVADWNLPPQIVDNFFELADVQMSGQQQPLLNEEQFALLDSALASQGSATGFERKLLKSKAWLAAAKLKFKDSVAIVNSTGRISAVARFAFRSCNQDGMWGWPRGINTTAKILSALSSIGFQSGATVLDVGAGCGEYLPGIISSGAKVVVQDLFSSNLAFMRQTLQIPTCGSEAVHALSQMPSRAFHFVISNGLCGEYLVPQRCHLLHETLRVAASAVFIGWNNFPTTDWKLCHFPQGNRLYTFYERELFGRNVEYDHYKEQEPHSMLAFVGGTPNVFGALYANHALEWDEL